MSLHFSNSLPHYSRQTDSFLLLFKHRLDYMGTPEEGSSDEKVGHVEVAHIIEISLEAGIDPPDELIEEFIGSIAVYMVFPYVREAMTRLPTEFGLPGITLPYLRRDYEPKVGNESRPKVRGGVMEELRESSP